MNDVLDVSDWLRCNAKKMDFTLFLLTLWWVWRWRNNMLLDNDHWPINLVMNNIQCS